MKNFLTKMKSENNFFIFFQKSQQKRGKNDQQTITKAKMKLTKAKIGNQKKLIRNSRPSIDSLT